jgi:biotin carboxylase
MVGGGTQAVPGIRMAKDMGLNVIVSDRNPDAPGFAFADAKLIADTYDPDATVTEARIYHTTKSPIHGVMCMATDVPHTVARVAQDLGLPGIDVQTAELAINKLAMKQKFAQDGVPIPWFSEVMSREHLLSLAEEKGFPLVIKPIDSRGSRGVLLLREGRSLDWAFDTAQAQSPTKRVMLEQYLSGPQISTESVVVNGQVYTPGFSDRNYELLETYAPNMIENGGSLPSFLDQQAHKAVCDAVECAAASLGVTNGIMKGDMVYSGREAYVIEVAARLSGGFFCTHEIPLNTGVSTVKAAIQLALGDPIDPEDLTPKYNRHVVQRFLFVPPGKVTHVEGVERAKQCEGVKFVDCWTAPGDTVIRPVHSGCSTAVVITVGDSFEHALKRAEAALSEIDIRTA